MISIKEMLKFDSTNEYVSWKHFLMKKAWDLVHDCLSIFKENGKPIN